jgi:hypothetical protein
MGVQKKWRPEIPGGPFEKTSLLSAGATLSGSGVSVVDAAATTLSYGLADPKPGVHKVIAYAANSTKAVTVSMSTAVVIAGTTYSTITLDAEGETVQLVGISTAAWALVGLGADLHTAGQVIPSTALFSA